jgi:hypothetical protein
VSASHPLVRKIKGNFCNIVFTSAGTESSIFCKEGDSNIDWFSLRLKLDNFTSGFHTTCADMAGGWEEVVAASSWVGTRAGTGVGVGSRGGADEAAERTKGAGEAAANE